MTSANVTHYLVKKDDKKVAEYRQNCMCKNTVIDELKAHTPYEDFTLILCHPDEHEAPHYTVSMSLSDYLLGVRPLWENDGNEET